ncbi:MAG: hypothetical protein NT027_03520, partial [Proteobacteria bacterium]|nr:hypothetical protein [Pseudomonadota bacterium]
EVPLYNISKRAPDIMKNVSTITKFLSINVEVDLLKHNNHNSELAHTIFTQSPYLKNCFLSARQDDKRVGGFITYNFLVSEASGNIKIIRRSGGTIVAPKLQDCVTKELLQIAIPIRKTMVGQLKLSFDYR